MFFLTPLYVKEARHLHHAAKKLLHYRRDLWTDDQVANWEQQLSSLKQAIRKRDRAEVEHLSREIHAIADRYAPPPSHAGWRENCEVIIIAVIIAAGVKAYFLQPFKIPTGSMQPTLNGIVGYRTEVSPPNPLSRVIQLFWLGRSYFDVAAKSDETISDMKENTYAHFFTFTTIITDRNTYTLFAPYTTLRDYFGIHPGGSYKSGETMVRGYIDTGDQVFVDKLSYNFIPPKEGDVFVFKTTGIRGIEDSPTFPQNMGSQHYIKRLAGLPGDTLRIATPDFFINDKIAPQKAFQRVMSEENGYRGYVNLPNARYLRTPKEPFTVFPKTYFALGDNSNNSSDSRYWGIVPEQNVAGKGLFVYWPFSKRWGLIR